MCVGLRFFGRVMGDMPKRSATALGKLHKIHFLSTLALANVGLDRLFGAQLRLAECMGFLKPSPHLYHIPYPSFLSP